MEEQREAEPQVQAAPERYPHLFEHEDAGLLLAPSPGWFKAAAGFLEVHLTYWLHEKGVLFASLIVPPQAPSRVWLRHWSSHIEAVRSAENLCGESVDYLRRMTGGMPLRETEDLDYDDFMNHLATRMNGEFH